MDGSGAPVRTRTSGLYPLVRQSVGNAYKEQKKPTRLIVRENSRSGKQPGLFRKKEGKRSAEKKNKKIKRSVETGGEGPESRADTRRARAHVKKKTPRTLAQPKHALIVYSTLRSTGVEWITGAPFFLARAGHNGRRCVLHRSSRTPTARGQEIASLREQALVIASPFC